MIRSVRRGPAFGGLLLCLFLAAALVAAAESANSLLPQTFAGWTASASSSAAPANLDTIAGDLGPVLREYGAQGAERAQYVRGSEQITVTLYRLRDPSGAYGAYSFLRTPEMSKSDLNRHSSASKTRALALLGNLVLDVSGRDLTSLHGDVRALLATLAPQAPRGPYPTLWQRLPLEGFIPGSDRYLLGPVALNRVLPLAKGDWLGFSTGAEAEVAKYQVQGSVVTLLLADYPTPQIAAAHLESMAQRFDLNSPVIRKGGQPVLYAKRALTLVALAVNSPSEEAANSLLRQVDSGTIVTWNEPSFTLTDPSISSVIIGTIVGTGILCMFALVAGLAFGGVRLFVKRLVPGKVFDRSSQLEILQLGLSSKPIEAKDFYNL